MSIELGDGPALDEPDVIGTVGVRPKEVATSGLTEGTTGTGDDNGRFGRGGAVDGVGSDAVRGAVLVAACGVGGRGGVALTAGRDAGGIGGGGGGAGNEAADDGAGGAGGADGATLGAGCIAADGGIGGGGGGGAERFGVGP